MFDVGFAEIFLLALIGLIVLGPEKLPRVARTVGGLVKRARSSWYSLRRSIEAEMAEADISEPIKKAASDLEASAEKLDQGFKEITRAANETVAPESDCGPDNDNGKLQGG